MNFMDPEVFPQDFVKHLDVETCKQVFEGGTHLRIFGEQVDRVSDENKLATFKALKALYEENGSPWKAYVWTGHTVNFDGANGFFTKRVDNDGRIMITCKGIQGDVEFSKTLYGRDPGPFDQIKANFSIRSAYFETAVDKYGLSFLFPVLGRSLKKTTQRGVRCKWRCTRSEAAICSRGSRNRS